MLIIKKPSEKYILELKNNVVANKDVKNKFLNKRAFSNYQNLINFG